MENMVKEKMVVLIDKDWLERIESKIDNITKDNVNEALNVKGAAKLLGVTEQTIYKKAKADELPYFKIGKALRFDKEKLEDIKNG